MAKRKRKEYIVKFEDIRGFAEEFARETDRGAAVLAVAFLSEWLRKRIASFLVDDSEKVDELLEDRAPLGGFYSRIGASYCMGLIGKDEYDDLHIIREIRNEFAHEPPGLSFSHEWVKDKCRELQLPKILPERRRPADARAMFTSATGILLQRLKTRTREEKERRVLPTPFRVEEVVNQFSAAEET